METAKINNDAFKLESLFNVKDEVAVVTGGGSGIGLMATQALAVNGAKVYITSRTASKLETVASNFGKGIQGSIIPLTCDVTSKDSIEKLVDEISSHESHVDILINNAGIDSGTFQTEASSASEMKANLFDPEKSNPDDWANVYKTNVASIFFMTMAFLPLLEKGSTRQGSHGWSSTVLNISSISGHVKLPQHHFQYNASKGATTHLNRMLAHEISSNNLKIRVNGIAPGVFPSEMTTGESDEVQKSAIPKEKFENKVPAARPGNDRDMGAAVLAMVCNTYINGEMLTVDGGYTLMAGL
ncbi:short-chain dehydrogenase [Lineolata rhizophorae]|uniref:Short-chain dehydrogenase n=1 Tax=Lineolata rhizophorae TaxID=578093 RepID=A0A6A6NVS0_9PEZI|nr:short-chain dehydrogenase [Lineolata rhizophorae]